MRSSSLRSDQDHGANYFIFTLLLDATLSFNKPQFTINSDLGRVIARSDQLTDLDPGLKAMSPTFDSKIIGISKNQNKVFWSRKGYLSSF